MIDISDLRHRVAHAVVAVLIVCCPFEAMGATSVHLQSACAIALQVRLGDFREYPKVGDLVRVFDHQSMQWRLARVVLDADNGAIETEFVDSDNKAIPGGRRTIGVRSIDLFVGNLTARIKHPLQVLKEPGADLSTTFGDQSPWKSYFEERGLGLVKFYFNGVPLDGQISGFDLETGRVEIALLGELPISLIKDATTRELGRVPTKIAQQLDRIQALRAERDGIAAQIGNLSQNTKDYETSKQALLNSFDSYHTRLYDLEREAGLDHFRYFWADIHDINQSFFIARKR